MKTPFFSLSAARRSISGLPARLLDVRFDLGSPLGRDQQRTSGCSGASTMNVTPNTVSGRVVKTSSQLPRSKRCRA